MAICALPKNEAPVCFSHRIPSKLINSIIACNHTLNMIHPTLNLKWKQLLPSKYEFRKTYLGIQISSSIYSYNSMTIPFTFRVSDAILHAQSQMFSGKSNLVQIYWNTYFKHMEVAKRSFWNSWVWDCSSNDKCFLHPPRSAASNNENLRNWT